MGSNTMNGMFGGKIQSSRWDFCFILFTPGDESPGYCHRCPACAEASAGRPLMGHQHRFKLALMPLEGEGWVGGIRNYCVCISNNLIRLLCIVVTHEEDVL